MPRYTENDIQSACNANLQEYLMAHGYELKKADGKSKKLEGYGGLFIFEKGFFHFSEENKGNQIHFLRQYMDMGFQDAVQSLLDFQGIRREEELNPPTYSRKNTYQKPRPQPKPQQAPQPQYQQPQAQREVPPPTAEPYGMPQPTAEPYGMPPPTVEPYGMPPPTAEPYGMPPPTAEPYGMPPPTAEPYGMPPPTAEPYGMPPPMAEPFEMPPPPPDDFHLPPEAFGMPPDDYGLPPEPYGILQENHNLPPVSQEIPQGTPIVPPEVQPIRASDLIAEPRHPDSYVLHPEEGYSVTPQEEVEFQVPSMAEHNSNQQKQREYQQAPQQNHAPQQEYQRATPIQPRAKVEEPPKEPMVLPPRSTDKNAYKSFLYLTQDRALDKDIVNDLLKQGKIFEATTQYQQ